MDSNPKAPAFLNIPTAIIIAGAIIAVSIIWTMKPAQTAKSPTENALAGNTLKAVTTDDHILGNPNAKIKIVEYSDPSCPFCKTFHNTMRRIMNEYGKSGNVAWIYRSFPIDKPGSRSDGGILHPNAGKEAQAMECADSLGGNDKFWAYANRFYEITPSVTGDTPNGLDQKELPKIAEYIGLNASDFKNCLDSGKFKDKVEQQYQDGLNFGIEGTPASIIITPSGKNIAIPGAQPFESLKQAIDALLLEYRSNS